MHITRFTSDKRRYDFAKAAAEADELGEKLDTNLSDFEFPDDFVLDVFELVEAGGK